MDVAAQHDFYCTHIDEGNGDVAELLASTHTDEGIVLSLPSTKPKFRPLFVDTGDGYVYTCEYIIRVIDNCMIHLY
jgi:hypothetical protein